MATTKKKAPAKAKAKKTTKAVTAKVNTESITPKQCQCGSEQGACTGSSN